jgi:long-chain acyl-CoA synthetase
VLIEQELETMSGAIAEVGVFLKDDLLQAVIRPNLGLIREKGITRMDECIRWQMIDRYNQKVSPAKRFHRFTLVESELPRTRLSKLKRFQLPALVAGRVERKALAKHPAGEEHQVSISFSSTIRPGPLPRTIIWRLTPPSIPSTRSAWLFSFKKPSALPAPKTS